jgi:epoxyqueuosine reductase
MDELTKAVKQYALNMGADLVGIASVFRYEGAPRMLRPQAHLPEAKSVISMAVHHTDGSVEWSGEPNPNYPAGFQIGMIPKLDMLSFRIGRFLEDKGYPTIPLPCTTYWRHRKYKDVPYEHAASFSHMNAFVAAGLGEYGWHGMVMSPKYGPRQRIISVITAAELAPDPLYNGEPLCDRCMMCAKHCPGQNYSEDRLNDPPLIEFSIEGKVFRYPSINRWRCFYGEQAHLDMNELSCLDEMNEERIYEAMKNGVQVVNYGYACNSFKYCMAKPVRKWDRKYSPGPRRKKPFIEKSCDEIVDSIQEIARRSGADRISVRNLNDFTELKGNFHKGFRTEEFFDSFTTVITIGRPINRYDSFGLLGLKNRSALRAAIGDRISAGIMDISRYLDDLGYDATQDWPMTGISSQAANEAGWNQDDRKEMITGSVICNLKLDNLTRPLQTMEKQGTLNIDQGLSFLGHIDKIGIGSLAQTALPDLSTIRKQNPGFQTLVALAIGMPERLVELAGKQEAEDGSAYAFINSQAQKEALWAAQDLSDYLEGQGYRSIPMADLADNSYPTIGKTGRNMPDLRANAPYAAAAGLGQLGRNGMLLTPEFGPRLRFVFVLTDAVLDETPRYQGPNLCLKDCTRCSEACPVCALSANDTETVCIGGVERYEVMKRHEIRCAWARSLGMVEGEGSGQLGWKLPDLPIPDTLTDDEISKALEEKDPIQRICYRNPNFTDIIIERCLQACPVGARNT